MRSWILIVLFMFCFNGKAQQPIINYVANGSFEEYDTCKAPPFPVLVVKSWTSPDSLCTGPAFLNICFGNVPFSSFGSYQYPHFGNAYMVTLLYDINTVPLNQKRVYAKNRMKSTLQAGKTYCVKFYVNMPNMNTYGVDGIGAYFGGSEIDTVTHCEAPLTYFTPQVQNPQGNIITDTLNWVAITGTFTANGMEKYLLLGNFLSDEDTDTLLINPTYLPYIWTDVLIDDVSCMDIDLVAYAGRDTTILLGDSVYIGREKDFALDEACTWYTLPNMLAIDTTSGMWVKPAQTTSYVVKQELDCGGIKWDTVVVKVVDGVGLNEYAIGNMQVEVYPNPANDLIKIESSIPNEEVNILIIDVTGRTVLNKKAEIKNHTADIELNLANGAYILKITNKQQKTISKKLVIAK